MTNPLVIVLIAQVLFSLSDIIARQHMKQLGFHVASFISSWFLVYFLIRMVAMFGQLYALANFELGRSQTLFGVTGLAIANIVGVLYFKEILSPYAYAGVVLAIIACLLVGFRKA